MGSDIIPRACNNGAGINIGSNQLWSQMMEEISPELRDLFLILGGIGIASYCEWKGVVIILISILIYWYATGRYKT